MECLTQVRELAARQDGLSRLGLVDVGAFIVGDQKIVEILRKR